MLLCYWYMRRRTIAIGAFLTVVIAALSLFFVLNMTNPSTGGPVIILLVLLLIYILFYGLIVLATMLFGYAYHLIAPSHTPTTTTDDRSKRIMQKTLAVCAIVSAAPIMLISLNSIGRIDFIDVLLVATIEVVASAYVIRKM